MDRISAIAGKRKEIVMIHSATLCRLDPILHKLSLVNRFQVGYKSWCTDEKSGLWSILQGQP